MTSFALDRTVDFWPTQTPSATQSRCMQIDRKRVSDYQKSVASFESSAHERFIQLLSELDAITREANRDNWDDQGSKALREDSRDRAPKLFALVCGSTPVCDSTPDMSVSGQGSLVLDWSDGPDWQLSLALTSRDTISFAGYFRGDRSHGEFPFYPERLPLEISVAFKRWTYRPTVGQPIGASGIQ